MKRFFKLVSMFVLAGATLTYTGCTDYDKDIDNLGKEVDALEGKLATLEQQVKNLEALKSQLSDLETKYAGLDKKHGEDVAALEKKIKDAQTALENSLKAYMTTEDAKKTFVMKDGLKQAIIDLGYFAEKTEVTTAKNLAQEALDSAKSALGNVAALKAALGVYAQAGAIQDSLDAKLSIDKFDEAFDAALTDALANDGKITKAIASAINSAVADFEKLFYGELRSLVFVPELYVNGIESVEYTYADYKKRTMGEHSKEGNSPADKAPYKYEKQEVNLSATFKQAYINPVKVLAYEMNPSSAKVEGNKLSFVSKDVDLITKAAAAAPEASFVEVKDGNLYVGFKADGTKIQMKSGVAAPKKATMFALEAVVNGKSSKDTTITSDYANVLASVATFDAIAFASKDYKAVTCAPDKNDHLYLTAVDAIEKKPSVEVAYNGKVNLAELVQIHYSVASDVTSSVKNHAVYKMNENPYNLKYEFNLIDYTSGNNLTSESQHAKIENGVLAPCGTTDGAANGKPERQSVGRRPLVQVLVKDAEGSVILAAYVRFVIVEKTEYTSSNKFDAGNAKFGCDGYTYIAKWHEIVDNILKPLDLTKEQFVAMYKLEEKSSKAVQYTKTAAGEYEASSSDLGVVVAKNDPDGGTTTNVFQWTLSAAELDAIYEANEEHTATIYIRYITNNELTSKYQGVYVPITVKVAKPAAGRVVDKIGNYWFNNERDAALNVHIPQAGAKTHPWLTDLNQVWNGNKPVIDGVPAGFPSYSAEIFATQNGGNGVGGYRYYFAPVQPKGLVTAEGTFDLSVDSKLLVDSYIMKDGSYVTYEVTSNDQIRQFEIDHAINANYGVYKNVHLYANEVGKIEKVAIADIDPETGVIKYNDGTVAKALLNAFASMPCDKAKLLANIGIVAYTKCMVAYPAEDAINPYHFLRPINVAAAEGARFFDGADSHSELTNLNVFGMLNITDWMNKPFYGVNEDNTLDLTNLWYYGFYEVNGVTVDVKNATTDLDGKDIKNDKLTEVTKKIILTHNTGTFAAPEQVSTFDETKPLEFNFSTPVRQEAWGQAQYDGLVKHFGFIHYQNNGVVVNTAFKVRVPVEVSYYWGTIKVYVDITVEPTLS